MFEDLYDEISKLWSWRWPVAQGHIVLVEIDRYRPAMANEDSMRLSVVYTFSIGDDGPYVGESFWSPAFSFNALKKLRQAKRKLHVGFPVAVRYRPDYPSVNKLDPSVWREL